MRWQHFILYLLSTALRVTYRINPIVYLTKVDKLHCYLNYSEINSFFFQGLFNVEVDYMIGNNAEEGTIFAYVTNNENASVNYTHFSGLIMSTILSRLQT